MEKISDGIYKIKIPFEDIYTSSFVLCNDGEYMVADSGSSAEDAEKYIIPKLEEMGIYPKYLLCSHFHGDHCGGIRALAAKYPKALIGARGDKLSLNNTVFLNDGELLLSRYKVIALTGHSDDSMGIFDTKNRVLLSFDCLQLRGVSRYGGGFNDFEKYINSIKKVRAMDVYGIAASHEFYPLGSMAFDEKKVEEYLLECEKAARYFMDFIRQNSHLDYASIAEKYNSQNPSFPSVSENSIKAILK